MKKALILYYSQAGQTQAAIEIYARGLQKNMPCDFVTIKTEEAFPFPWRITEFFRAFPRCVRGITPSIEPLEINWDQYDLIILGCQVWFLSPSLPIQSFLKSSYANGLKNKKVITLMTCRNLWHSASKTLHKLLQQLGAFHQGQITIGETSPVWASFVTTPRWMLTGRKSAFAFFPAAGISAKQLATLETKGEKSVRWCTLKQEWLVTNEEFGSNLNRVSLVLMDRIGYQFFLFWSALILRIAKRQGRWQDFLLILFRLNLVLLILSVGPCTKIFELLVRNDSKYLD